MKTILLFLIIYNSFLLIVSSAFAQEKENPDRMMVQKLGLNTYTAATLPRAFLLPETEFIYIRINRNFIYNITAGLPKLNLRYGITDRFEVNIGTSFNYSTTRLRSTGEPCLFCRTWYGNDFITAGFRANIWQYNEGEGLLTLSGEINIPGTKTERVRSLMNFPRLQLVNSGRLGSKFGYIINLGAGTEEGYAYFGLFNFGGATTWNLSEKISLFVSLSQQIKDKQKKFGPLPNSLTAADGGFLYSLLPNLQLQAAAGVSIFDQDQNPDLFAKMGMAWGIPFLKQ